MSGFSRVVLKMHTPLLTTTPTLSSVSVNLGGLDHVFDQRRFSFVGVGVGGGVDNLNKQEEFTSCVASLSSITVSILGEDQDSL